MSLFDRAKAAYKQSEERRAATLTNVEYMGGFQGKKKALGNLSFNKEQLVFKVALNARSSFVIPTTDIVDMTVEGKDEVSRRVTVTRLIAVGIFAFALQKKGRDKDAFVAVTLADGQEAIFHVKNQSPMELRARLSQTISQIKQYAPQPTAAAVSVSIADELAKLAKLKDDGVITQAEFDKKKTELLA